MLRAGAALMGALTAANAASDERLRIYIDPEDDDGHAGDAQAAGNPTTGTVDRAAAASRRRERLRGVPTVPGMDRDEYPPAVIKPDATGVSVRHIPSAGNRRAGQSIGQQLRGVPDGTPVEVISGKKPNP